MMQWMFAVIAVGLSALVNVCQAEEVEMCNEGYASAQNINLTIALTPSSFRCCCHLDFKAAQTVWRRTTVDCGITLVHDVTFLDKNCSQNTSISQAVDQNKTDLCVVRENGLQQNKSLTGHMILQATSYDIDVNCSEPVLMSPSTGSNPPGVSEVKPTTESTTPSTSSGKEEQNTMIHMEHQMIHVHNITIMHLIMSKHTS
ncbi:uncharacterized protein LOC125373489 [Haliotis rufescens]|uniref:uncharacterized protein LOC125373489 n=1 Tax=Haliotis rufescens TaxID=6454 RepID=UPI00201ED6DD|nr:uncharacterized protein LOC125373489 [Haliotis rufescens]